MESDMAPWTMGKVAPPYKVSLLHNVDHAPARLRESISGLSESDLDAEPVPGKWSTRRVIEHVVLASLGWTDILYEAVCPYHTKIKTWQKGWSDALVTRAKSSTPDALAVIEQNHREVIAFLGRLPEESFTFEHAPVQWLVGAKIPFVIKESVNWGLSVHVDHHLIFIHEKHVALGKPLEWMSGIRTA